ncbi:hypothetical protein [Pyrinomonas methylaliphatogenes]|jgi:hypothetical protein|uniref:DUF3185 domain-containing protein n=1 Tax=Pyrinomonas methylaliphatogenes TaxID=454194 RepID=A0A0B6X3P2_9BACT|nr:hypothetical protein [Pyrinomonas methylaliphatogenes]MBX5478059.1 hypothetical protein [Pyrinomonas methylaliphatogenes]CDM66920.1 hypothetical protein PYK22_02962 [Pyrinomonas methylaliphatogenes]
MRLVIATLGIVIAAIGGVIAYRAAFIEPSVGLLITDARVRPIPNGMRIAAGLLLLIGGATAAFIAARGRSD